MKDTSVKSVKEKHPPTELLEIKNDTLRNSFIDLAIKTFDLSFENWYNNGFWTDKYIPYVLVQNEKVIANASVNIINTIWKGKPKCYIQIGTVMTDMAYRNQGLSRRLINEILTEWKEKCDAVYLFANDMVLDFYPKFGFQKEVEYQYTMPITAITGDFEKLNMDKESSRELLKRCYQKMNPFSELPMKDNYELLMFYCADFMKDCVYYSKKHDAICIAMHEENTLICFDIFCDQNISMKALLSEIAESRTHRVILGFAPTDTKECECEQIEGENTLFMLASKENVFANHKVMFPLLSHA